MSLISMLTENLKIATSDWLPQGGQMQSSQGNDPSHFDLILKNHDRPELSSPRGSEIKKNTSETKSSLSDKSQSVSDSEESKISSSADTEDKVCEDPDSGTLMAQSEEEGDHAGQVSPEGEKNEAVEAPTDEKLQTLSEQGAEPAVDFTLLSFLSSITNVQVMTQESKTPLEEISLTAAESISENIASTENVVMEDIRNDVAIQVSVEGEGKEVELNDLLSLPLQKLNLEGVQGHEGNVSFQNLSTKQASEVSLNASPDTAEASLAQVSPSLQDKLFQARAVDPQLQVKSSSSLTQDPKALEASLVEVGGKASRSEAVLQQKNIAQDLPLVSPLSQQAKLDFEMPQTTGGVSSIQGFKLNSLSSRLIQEATVGTQNHASLEEWSSMHQQIREVLHSTIQEGDGEVQLHLTPPEWGKIDIQVRLDKNDTHLSFVTEHAFVKENLVRHLSELKQMFAQNDGRLVHVNIGMQQDSQSSSQEKRLNEDLDPGMMFSKREHEKNDAVTVTARARDPRSSVLDRVV